MIDPVYIDDHLLVVDKPSGLLSVPGRGPENADCVSARVQVQWPDALIVHRLDMGTSGLLAFGRGLDAQRRLNEAFAKRRVEKHYEAVVDGLIEADSGEIDLPLIADWPARPRQKVCHETGKPSLTRWQVVSRDTAQRTTRVALAPLTGRSHQLRVHLASLGHPILGDDLYARPEVQALAPRLLLHARVLALPHPDDGRWVRFEAPCPF